MTATKDSEKLFHLRFGDELRTMLNEVLQQMHRDQPGVTLTMADAVRTLLHEAISMRRGAMK